MPLNGEQSLHCLSGLVLMMRGHSPQNIRLNGPNATCICPYCTAGLVDESDLAQDCVLPSVSRLQQVTLAVATAVAAAAATDMVASATSSSSRACLNEAVQQDSLAWSTGKGSTATAKNASSVVQMGSFRSLGQGAQRQAPDAGATKGGEGDLGGCLSQLMFVSANGMGPSS